MNKKKDQLRRQLKRERKRRDKNRESKKVHQWSSFVEADPISPEEACRVVRKEIVGTQWANMSDEEVKKAAEDLLVCKTYINHLYQVAVYPQQEYVVNPDDPESSSWPAMIHLSIKRRDKQVMHDWAHLQLIKNELVGQEHEAVELYPAESRVVNLANQYHLWVLADPKITFPFGFQAGRNVAQPGPDSNAKNRLMDTLQGAQHG